MELNVGNKKVLMVGLGGAGKTSIGIFLRTYNTRQSLDTRPSITVERYSKKGVKSVDLVVTPGQKRFLKSLLGLFKSSNQLTQALSRAHVVIYVIDAADRQKLPEAIEYFKALLEKLVEEPPIDRKLLVLAHKQDLPNALSGKAIEDLVVKPLKPLIKRAGLTVKVFETSIYRPSSLLKVLYEITDGDAPLERALKALQEATDAATIFIGDTEGILIASSGDRELAFELLYAYIKLRETVREIVTSYAYTTLFPLKGPSQLIFRGASGKFTMLYGVDIDDGYQLVAGCAAYSVPNEEMLGFLSKILERFAKRV